MQTLIESAVQVGDPVSLNYQQIKWDEESVGCLRRNGKKPPKPGDGTLEVAAVLRFMQTDEGYRASWCQSVQDRRPPWSWVVCVRGFYNATE